jgi:hypothetical protein
MHGSVIRGPASLLNYDKQSDKLLLFVLFLEIVCVDLSVMLPFVRQGIILGNGFDGQTDSQAPQSMHSVGSI